jgi:hypothetical protein
VEATIPPVAVSALRASNRTIPIPSIWKNTARFSRRWANDTTGIPNLINDNIGRVPSEAMPALEELTGRAGSRLLLRELAHPATGRPGDLLSFEMQWAIVGVGTLYRAWVLRVEFFDRGSERPTPPLPTGHECPRAGRSVPGEPGPRALTWEQTADAAAFRQVASLWPNNGR